MPNEGIFAGLGEFLKKYNVQYDGRPTRIAVFEAETNGLTDYWLENGLPLRQIEIDRESGHTIFRISAGEYSHEVRDPARITFHFTPGSDEDGVDVAESAGRTLIVRFEE